MSSRCWDAAIARSYDPASKQYTYAWKTEQAGAGRCGQLVVWLNDGTATEHVANFVFK